MKGLMRKFSKDLSTSKDILECLEEKENLKRTRSLEAILDNGKLNQKGNQILSYNEANKKQLSAVPKIGRKSSDTSGFVIKRKVSAQPDIRVRAKSINETKPRKVSLQPEFNVKGGACDKRVCRKVSLQPEMMAHTTKKITDQKARKMSVPANMKFNSEKVRVKKVSFINQHTGQSFQMAKPIAT